MHVLRRFMTIALLSMAFASTAFAEGKTHRIAIHVDQNDPQVMNMALNNVENLVSYFHDKGEKIEVEVVAYGAGLNMMRSDTSRSALPLKRPVIAKLRDPASTSARFSVPLDV